MCDMCKKFGTDIKTYAQKNNAAYAIMFTQHGSFLSAEIVFKRGIRKYSILIDNDGDDIVLQTMYIGDKALDPGWKVYKEEVSAIISRHFGHHTLH